MKRSEIEVPDPSSPYIFGRVIFHEAKDSDQVEVSPNHWVRTGSIKDLRSILKPGQRWIRIRRGRAGGLAKAHRSSHGNKIVHRWWICAWWHAWELNHRKDRPGRWEPYPCRWGGDWRAGPLARRHWHVGRYGRLADRLDRRGMR